MRILVIYDSRTGNTEKMALAVAEGARENRDVQVTLKKVDEVSNEDLLEAAGIVIGSPTYYGQMSSKIKTLFDKSISIHGKLAGKVGAAFTSSGGAASGAETTIISILTAMLIHGMIIQGQTGSGHYGAAAVGTPKETEIKKCREIGRMISNLVIRLKP